MQSLYIVACLARWLMHQSHEYWSDHLDTDLTLDLVKSIHMTLWCDPLWPWVRPMCTTLLFPRQMMELPSWWYATAQNPFAASSSLLNSTTAIVPAGGTTQLAMRFTNLINDCSMWDVLTWIVVSDQAKEGKEERPLDSLGTPPFGLNVEASQEVPHVTKGGTGIDFFFNQFLWTN